MDLGSAGFPEKLTNRAVKSLAAPMSRAVKVLAALLIVVQLVQLIWVAYLTPIVANRHHFTSRHAGHVAA